MKNSKTVKQEEQPTTAKFEPKIIIIDDDPIIAAVMKHHLKGNFPNAYISSTNEPVIRPGYDIYFLDNDFGGTLLAKSLLREIRELSPHSLVVALSNTLDVAVMQDLMNGGCNVVYNKKNPADSSDAREVIHNYISILEERYNQKSSPSLVSLVGSVKQLLGAWNTRLGKEAAL